MRLGFTLTIAAVALGSLVAHVLRASPAPPVTTTRPKIELVRPAIADANRDELYVTGPLL